MTLGNIFICIAAFFCIALAKLTASKPPSNEYGVGYHWGTFFLVIGFALSGLILSIIILSRGGFGWISLTTGWRISLVVLYWWCIVLTMFYCAHFKWEWHVDTAYPKLLHVLARSYGHVWIPMLWLGVCFFSLHTDLQISLPIHIKVPFWLGFGLSTLFTCGLLTGYAGHSFKRIKAKIARQTAQQDRWHLQSLNTIAAHTPHLDPMVNLLSHTSRNHPDDIRQAALAKIKSHSNWEEELLRLLNHKKAYKEVYYFLDGNQVKNPQLFAESLKQSIVWMAETIKADIKDSNNLPPWSYNMYGIDHLLSAIDYQFPDKGTDFYPTVLILKQALHTTPADRFKGVRFTVTKIVDRWLRKHKK